MELVISLSNIDADFVNQEDFPGPNPIGESVKIIVGKTTIVDVLIEGLTCTRTLPIDRLSKCPNGPIKMSIDIITAVCQKV